MKNALSRLAGTLATLSALPWQAAHAASAADLQKCGILAGAVGNNSKDCQEALRSGDIHFDSIPGIIKTATDILLGTTGTVAMVAIIVGGFKYALGGVESDKTQGKDAVKYGIAGFVVSALAWFSVRLVIDNL